MIRKNLMLAVLVGALGGVALTGFGWSATDANDKPIYLRNDWGVVQSIEFVRKVKSSRYYKVTTDKVVFHEVDVTDFPDGKVTIGDIIFEQNQLQSRVVKTSHCKNDMCLAVASCYSWMPCFDEYEPLLKRGRRSDS